MAKSRLNTENGLWSALSKNQPVRYQTRKGFATLEEEVNNNEVLQKAWNQALKQSPKNSKEMTAIYCYTMDDYFYKHLNKSIRDWYDDTMDVQFPFGNYVSLLMSQVRNFDNYLTLYRGVSFDTQLSASIGAVVYTNQFESCSSVKAEAEKFAYNGTLYTFKTKSAIYVCEHSKFPQEKEYIIPPELKFTVTQVKPRDGKMKYFEVVLEMSTQQYDLSQRLISKLKNVSISANYSITYEYGFKETEKLAVVRFCETATNSKESDYDIAEKIYNYLITSETCVNFWWHVIVDKNVAYSHHAFFLKALEITINGYKIVIYGFQGVPEKNTLELARKNISKLKITESTVTEEQKDVIFNEVKYAIKYCDSFFDIAKSISNELRNHSKTKGRDWNVIVQDVNSYFWHLERVYFNLGDFLKISVYSTKQ